MEPPPSRKPWAVALLSLATIGVYGFVWWSRFGREVDARSDAPFDARRHFRQVLFLFLAILTIPVALVHFWIYKFKVTRRTARLAQATGVAMPATGVLYLMLVLPVLGLLAMALLQSAANRIWVKVPVARVATPSAAPTVSPAVATVSPTTKRIRCPKCKGVVAVGVVPGRPTVARCGNCGFSAPYAAR